MKMKWIAILLSCLFVFMQVGGVLAEDQTNSNQASVELPKLSVSNITFSKIGQTTKGSFDVENQKDFYAGDLNCNIEIYKGEKLSDWVLVSKTVSAFEIYPLEKKTVNFVHTLPENLSSGTFHIAITIKNRTGLPVGFNMAEMGVIEGNNIYLDSVAEDKILDKDQEVDSLSGPSYDPNEAPTAYITVKSAAYQAITAQPKITVYARDYKFKSEPVKVVEGDKIEFQPKEQKKLEIKLPGMNEPESYLASVVMLDETGKEISGIHEFRYVVTGASAKILSVQAVPNTDGSKLEVSAMVIGPADATEIKGALVEVKVYDDNTNDLIKQESKTIDLGILNQTVNILSDLGKSASDVRVETSIKYQNKVLDTNILKVPGAALLQEKARPADVVDTKYEYAVGKLIDAGIINGYLDGTFKPDQSITRAEFVKIASLLVYKQSDIDKLASVTKFKDVKKNHWAGKYINSAVSGDLVKGYPGGTFKPENNVTYGEAVTVLVRMLGYQKEMDTQGGKWPDNYISKGLEVGVTAGMNMDKPSLAATRGDVAILVWNTYKVLKSKE